MLPVLLSLVIPATALAVDTGMWRGIITAKYFYFTVTVCVALIAYTVTFASRNRNRSESRLYMTDIAAALFFVYVCFNCILKGCPTDMRLWLFLLMPSLYMVTRAVAGNRKQYLLNAILLTVLTESVWGLLQLAGLVPKYHSMFHITGSFFNPGPYAGFVAICIPLALSQSVNKEVSRMERWLGILALLASVAVLPFAMSRAAWLAAIAGSLPVFFRWWSKFKIGSRRLSRLWQLRSVRITSLVTLVITVSGLFAGLYYMKKASADGRWLIWNVCINIVKERPFFGAGPGRFAAVYGEAQADYFRAGKGGDTQIMVADAPDYAFNEYMQIAVESGLTGLILFIVMISGIFHSRQSSDKNGVKRSMFALSVFAAFSYPFSVLPLAVLFVVLLALSASQSARLPVTPSVRTSVICVILCLMFTLNSATHIFPHATAYRYWKLLTTDLRSGNCSEILPEYEMLYEQLRHEKNFLSEYARCLSAAGYYERGNTVYRQCLLHSATSEIYIATGNNYKAMGDIEQAEKSYCRALHITPNRHYPLYLLMVLYRETGQNDKALQTAQNLLEKQVKIPSQVISKMKEEAKKITDNR
jgi:O-antigen ligase